MIKKELKCFYTVSQFPLHSKLKDTVLAGVNSAECEHIIAPIAEVDISRGDWYNAENSERPWVTALIEPLLNHMSIQFHDLGYDHFNIKQIWFQQYQRASGHGWHIHGCNFTNVYYLDLPKDASRTQLVVPWDQKEIIEVELEEGDILTFPSFVIHRGPPNYSSRPKTIISYNIDIDYPDSQYGKGLT
jgi:hypothetical protein